MRARRILGTGVATAVALALAPTVAPAAAHGPAPLTIRADGCDEHVGIFPVPRDAVGVRLPEGFSLADPLGLDPTGRSAGLLVIGVECAQVAWQRGARRHVRADEPSLLVLVTVQPPAHLALPGAAFHTVALAVLAEDAAHAAAQRSAGVHAGTGSIALTWPSSAADGEHVTRGEGDGVAVTLRVQPQDPSTSAGLTHRIFSVQGGQVRGVLDVSDVPHVETLPGAATVELTGLPLSPALPPTLHGIGLTGLGLELTLVLRRVVPAGGPR